VGVKTVPTSYSDSYESKVAQAQQEDASLMYKPPPAASDREMTLVLQQLSSADATDVERAAMTVARCGLSKP